MAVLKFMTGNETRGNTSAKVVAFICGSERFHVHVDGTSEVFASHAPSFLHGAVKKISHTYETAFPTLRREMGGWFTTYLEVPDEMIFKFFAYRKAGWNGVAQMSQMYIATRATGAYRRISIPLTQGDGARHQVATIEGRFDIITPEVARSRFKVRANPRMDARFIRGGYGDLFSDQTVLEPEVVIQEQFRKQTIETESGETKVVQVKRRNRRIDI